MADYNTKGITTRPKLRPTGGNFGLGSKPKSTPVAEELDSSFFDRVANWFSDSGADLPNDDSNDSESGISVYDGPAFDISSSRNKQKPVADDDALREVLDMPTSLAYTPDEAYEAKPEEDADVVEELPEGEPTGLMTKPKGRPMAFAEAAEDSKPFSKDKLIDSVFKAEGGYSTDKDDAGNYYNGKFIGTNHGISAPTLAKKLGREPTVEEMKALTKSEAKQIAGEEYYDRFSIDLLPKEVQEIVLHATFMGESRGVRAMQNLLGLTPDGIMGPDTRAGMANANFTKEEFKDAYLNELQFGTKGYSKPSATWNKHGKGWTNRYRKLAK